MNKNKRIALLYYSVLFGGFLLFVSAILIGYWFFNDEVQYLFDNYPVLALGVLVGYFIVFLYALKVVVSKKEFEDWEKESRKMAIENKDKNKKRLKNAIPYIGVFTLLHIVSAIFLLWLNHNGVELNDFLECWVLIFPISIIVLSLAIYIYKKDYK